MKLSLLDTDILSEFLRGNVKVSSKVDTHLQGFGFINLSIITYYEILNGLLYKDAEIQADLRKKGKEIGHTDTLIAGIAMSNNLQLITNNTEHFKRIKGLEIANWLK